MAGTYSVTAIDANGCETYETHVITEPEDLVVTGAITSDYNGFSVSCFGASNGSIVTNASGGVTPYAYAWSNGASTANLDDLPAGVYTLTLSDANACEEVISFTLTEPSLLSLDAQASPINCYGVWDGSIDLSVTGGVAPFVYAWSNTAITQDIINLGPGTYTVTVIDANGCMAEASAMITQPNQLEVEVVSITNATCGVGNDGAIDVSVTGGTSPYSYTWSNGATTQDISSLAPGLYDLTVIDSNGCEAYIEAEVLPGTGSPVAMFTWVDAGGNVSFINFSVNVGPNDECIWDFGDGSALGTSYGLDNILHEFTASGVYEVTLIVSNDCGSDTLTQQVEIKLVSIEDLDNEEVFTVYPNPNRGLFKVRLATEYQLGEVTIQIHDVTGRIILTDQLYSQGENLERSYDLSSVSPGTYFIRLLTEPGVLTRSIIIGHK